MKKRLKRNNAAVKTVLKKGYRRGRRGEYIAHKNGRGETWVRAERALLEE